MSRWFRTYGFVGVLDGLLIGAYPLDAEDVKVLSRLGVERVLNLVEDDEYPFGERDAVRRALAASGIVERRLALVDYDGLPPERLEAALREVTRWLEQWVQAYMHCRAGRQRSPAVASDVVAVPEGKGMDEALGYVQAHKPSADLLPGCSSLVADPGPQRFLRSASRLCAPTQEVVLTRQGR